MPAGLPLPIGVIARSLQDRFASRLSGGYAIQGNVAGQQSYTGLFNNATDGSFLRVYQVEAGVSANTFVIFEYVSGNPGTLYTGASPYGAIDPTVGKTPGQTIIFTSPVCLGTHIGGVEANAGQRTSYAPGWPIGIVPPGYSFVMQTVNQNIVLETGIVWLPVPGPLTVRL